MLVSPERVKKKALQINRTKKKKNGTKAQKRLANPQKGENTSVAIKNSNIAKENTHKKRKKTLRSAYAEKEGTSIHFRWNHDRIPTITGEVWGGHRRC